MTQNDYRGYRPKKLCFTLLELLIVLFIISFGVILTGVKIKGIVEEQRFLSETGQVTNYLAMAQDLMLIMDVEVQVKFAPHLDSKKLSVWLEVEKPIKRESAHFIERKLVLNAIHSVEFEAVRGKELTLFFSLGRMSKGTLVLHEEENKTAHGSIGREFKIELPGYPAPLKAQDFNSKNRENSEGHKIEKSQKIYPLEN